jgi:hypothetical protein
MKINRFTFVFPVILVLTGCVDPYPPTMRPDYVIRVVPTAHGDVAVGPTCASWAFDNQDPYDNQPLPQFGCATAQNLAAMAERPDDLVAGRPIADARGVTEVGAIRRYDNNQTRGLITPDAEVSQVAATTMSTSQSSLTGDITGGAGAATTSPAASAASTP